MKISSSAFKHNGKIPSVYTCDGKNINPSLEFHDIPKEAQSLTLIMEDPDVPHHLRKDGMWDHWILEAIAKLRFCRFLGSFEPIFDFFKGVNINFRILTPLKKSKIGQNNPKNRRTLNFATASLFNISPSTHKIKENSTPICNAGKTTWGHTQYGGPCPPDREHRYFFKLYALDTMLKIPTGATKQDIEKAMKGHILAQAELIGLYEKKK